MRRFVAVVILGVLLAGCYTLRPVRGTAPEVGSRVAFDLTDAGRAALGGAIGPEIGQIEGRLVAKENGEYVIAVTAVRLLRGGEQVWTGEQVRVKTEHVGPAYERRFDRARSLAVGGTVVGGFTAFLIGRALQGAGQGDNRGARPDSGQANRGRP